MRTTVNIHDGLLQQARELAARTRRPLGKVFDDALRLLLLDSHKAVSRGPVELPTYGGSGLMPGVDLEDKEAMAAILDAERGDPHAAG